MVDFRQPIEKRMTKKANIAEEKCKQFLKNNNVYFHKFGFDCWEVPTKEFMKLPTILRNTPDFVCIGNYSFFTEAKGYKGYLKIKEEDLGSYKYWNKVMKLFFFFYDFTKQKHHFISFSDLNDKIPLAEMDTYSDNNKTYYKIRL